MNDTPKHVEALFRRKLMELTGEERLRMGSEMHECAREIVLASLPAGLGEGERRRRLFLRFYSGDFDEVTTEKIADLVARSADRDGGAGPSTAGES